MKNYRRRNLSKSEMLANMEEMAELLAPATGKVGPMFNLSQANEGIRKAAAMAGISSGKYEPVFDRENQSDTATIAKVYNRNHPDGIEILQGEAENALNYTWQEIRAR